MGTNKNWDQAEFTNLRSLLGRSVPRTRITVPAWIDLSEDHCELTFNPGPDNATVRVRHTQADPKMLNEFVDLCNQTPRGILKFARRWGVLYLDKYGRPCQVNGPADRREPIEVWKYWSRRAQAVLNIAAALKLGELGGLEDWSALRGTLHRTGSLLEEMDRYSPFLLTMVPKVEYPFKKDRSPSIDHRYKRSVELEKGILGIEATLWLKLARVGFAVGSGRSGWGLLIDYNECMFAAVALQLALVLADVRSLYQCSGCNLTYARTKKAPKPDQENFCDRCGLQKAVQRADRRRRQKRLVAKRLAEQGVSVAKIAERLNSSPETIRHWTRKKTRSAKPRLTL